MIAILTDKPSVGKEIGRIIGARKRLHGYVDFREHAVTGHAEGLRNPKAGTE